MDVDGVLHDSGVGAAVRDRYNGGPAQYPPAVVDGDQAVFRQSGGVEGFPGGRGGLERGVTVVDTELVDLQDFGRVVGSHGRDPDGFAHAGASIRRSANRPRIRRSISSRIGRTASTPWPAGSSSCQSK